MRTPETTKFCADGHQPLDYEDFKAHCIRIRPWADWGKMAFRGEATKMDIGECSICKSTISYPPPALRQPTTTELKTMTATELRAVSENRSLKPGVRARALRSWMMLSDAGLETSNLCSWRNGEIVGVPSCFEPYTELDPKVDAELDRIQERTLAQQAQALGVAV